MFNDQFLLVVHPHTTGAHRSYGVQAWLERGQQLKNQVMPPKLVWKRTCDETRQAAPTSSLATSMSLLDIVRILEAEHLVAAGEKPRNLARTCHTIHIQTLDESFWVEAESREERDRLVHGLKCVVARLASMLLLSDERLLDEFFLCVPDSDVAVGREPYAYLLLEDDDRAGGVHGTLDANEV
jgi:hypothetical protein